MYITAKNAQTHRLCLWGHLLSVCPVWLENKAHPCCQTHGVKLQQRDGPGSKILTDFPEKEVGTWINPELFCKHFLENNLWTCCSDNRGRSWYEPRRCVFVCNDCSIVSGWCLRSRLSLSSSRLKLAVNGGREEQMGGVGGAVVTWRSHTNTHTFSVHVFDLCTVASGHYHLKYWCC